MSSSEIQFIQKCFNSACAFIEDANDRILKLYSSDFATEFKSDNSPVTELDKTIEEDFIKFLSKFYPDHGLVGEEFGAINIQSPYQWIIDPIDGTLSMVNRVPTFGTMISLRIENVPVLGIIHHPALGITVSGYKGQGVTYKNSIGENRKVSLKSVDSQEVDFVKHMVGVSSPNSFMRGGALSQNNLQKIISSVAQARMYYDCFGLSHLASGGLAGYVEANARIWDLAAIEFLVQEAGGVYLPVGQTYDGTNYDQRFSALLGAKNTVNKLLEIIT
jgi:fructose-1,6-bisphosphatase/inositol monophosphatase family enzyme